MRSFPWQVLRYVLDTEARMGSVTSHNAQFWGFHCPEEGSQIASEEELPFLTSGGTLFFPFHICSSLAQLVCHLHQTTKRSKQPFSVVRGRAMGSPNSAAQPSSEAGPCLCSIHSFHTLLEHPLCARQALYQSWEQTVSPGNASPPFLSDRVGKL